jgi:formylglycine-generating enzyme required for sulfatase activity
VVIADLVHALSAEHTESTLRGMRHVPAGVFTMGSDRFYPEERPRRRVKIDAFWMDETPVTNRQFAQFVEATGYRTFAEVPPNPADYPGMPSEMARAGSLVFERPLTPVDPNDWQQWWQFRFGAHWRQPLGEGSSIATLADHPVVHIAYVDAEAYAKWAGKSLPTEAEWEYAARAGLETEYAWGDELAPGGRMLANYWQGEFPHQNLLLDGWERTSPVGSFPANAFGLQDLIGNVWEWTSDPYVSPAGSCCSPLDTQDRIGRKVLKGGSHLCAPNYCQRYRPAARYPQAIDTSTSHVGFRCIVRERS